MHEQTLLADLRRKLEEIARASPDSRIRRVTIRVGPLAHLTEATLRRRWSELTEASAFEGAVAVVEVGADPPDPAAAEVRIVSVTLDDAPGPGPAGSRLNGPRGPGSEGPCA